MRSLRTRLALISTLVSGVAIVGVSVLAWFHMVRAVRDSLDVRLEGISGRLVRDMHPRANWDRFRERIEITHGDEVEEGLLVLHVRDDLEGQVVYSSLEDYDSFRETYPEGFPTQPPRPRPRPEWGGGPPGPGRGKGGPGSRPPRAFPRESGEESPSGAKGERDRPKPPPLGGESRDREAASDEGAPEEWEGGRSDEEDALDRLLEGLDGLEDPAPGMEEWEEILNDPFTPIGGNRELATIAALGKDWRVIIVHERGYFVMVGLDLTRSIADLKRLEQGFLVGIPLAILLIGFGGWLVAERALRPIRNIATTASNITARDLSLRIDESGHSDPEIENMIAVLNGMMDRLEQGFSHANRFSSDVSHELKTPIAVMQAEIETALGECRPDTPEEARLLVLREEAGRLKSITRSLMLLAQADVGELIRVFDPVDLSSEVVSLVEDAEILADRGQVRIESEISEGVRLRGDAVLLRQALLNLVSNGIKYNEKGGFVRICLEGGKGSGIRLSVENSGPGIPPESRDKIFDRFFRADRARTRGVDGYGLGLSLAQAVIEGHGGTITLEKADEESTRFLVTLPDRGA